MFFSKRKGDDKSEDMKRIEEQNMRLEKQLAEMEKKFAQLTSQEDGAKGPNKKEAAMKDIYEDQLQQVFKKNLELEEKIKRMDQMMSEVEAMERRKKEVPQVQPSMQHPNTPNNWMPPNSPFYGPQGGGPMGFHQQGGMPFTPPLMQFGPMPSQQQPSQNQNFHPGPQNNFQPPNQPHMKNQNQYRPEGPRYNRPHYGQRDDNRNKNQGNERPLFLNKDQHQRSKSQSRQRQDSDVSSENQKHVRFEQRGRGGRGGGNYLSQRNSSGPDHNRRTNFKRSTRGRQHDNVPRNAETSQAVDSDDLSDSISSSGEEVTNNSTGQSVNNELAEKMKRMFRSHLVMTTDWLTVLSRIMCGVAAYLIRRYFNIC